MKSALVALSVITALAFSGTAFAKKHDKKKKAKTETTETTKTKTTEKTEEAPKAE